MNKICKRKKAIKLLKFNRHVLNANYSVFCTNSHFFENELPKIFSKSFKLIKKVNFESKELRPIMLLNAIIMWCWPLAP